MGTGRVQRHQHPLASSRGGPTFEVQFHTQASLDAKEETHWAYERLRSLPEDEDEVRELHAYQREVTSKVPIPPGALKIPDYP